MVVLICFFYPILRSRYLGMGRGMNCACRRGVLRDSRCVVVERKGGSGLFEQRRLSVRMSAIC